MRGGSTNLTTAVTQEYRYDPYGNYGNMYLTALPTSGPPVDPTTPVGSGWIDSTRNRLVNPGIGIGYDNAGNMTSINGSNWSYDAENRLKSSTLGGNTTTYAYDGDGRRVQKVSGGAATTYVYDAAGQLAAEYNSVAPTGAPCSTCYLTADHLGSTRMMTDASGTVKSLHDYLPFGEEIPAGFPSGAAGRGSAYPPSTLAINDTVTEKFTGKERDQETGLDYFGARYFSAAQGRWTSPDPTFLALNRLVNPQRWNMYGYALNSPFRYVDPDGQDAMFVVFKDYRPSIFGVRALALGHAATVVVDSSGHTTYREYGRYDPRPGDTSTPPGLLRPQAVPDLVMDANGHPTDASMLALLQTMSSENQNGSVDVIYYDTTDDIDALLLKELARRMAENKDPKRPGYALENHNCGTLFCETMRAAGQPIPAPGNRAAPIDTLQMLLANSQWWVHYSYDPKKKQVKKEEKKKEVVTSTIKFN